MQCPSLLLIMLKYLTHLLIVAYLFHITLYFPTRLKFMEYLYLPNRTRKSACFKSLELPIPIFHGITVQNFTSIILVKYKKVSVCTHGESILHN